ncbi:MAG: hypothetical protein QX196_07595 [Methylococcaceae bacterium]
MAGLTADIDNVRMSLYLEIEKADRTATSLIEQGYARSHVQYCMPILIASGAVFKYGYGKTTYYSVDKLAPTEMRSFKKKVNPVVIADAYKQNPALAFRMGYTDIEPAKGRVFKGLMHHE